MERVNGDADRHGDYEQVDDGPAVRLVLPLHCDRGHPIRKVHGWRACPRCGVPTTTFTCGDLYCDGMRTSRAHEQDCPREGG